MNLTLTSNLVALGTLAFIFVWQCTLTNANPYIIGGQVELGRRRCDDTRDGYRSHPHDCTMVFKCKDYEGVLYQCAHGFAWENWDCVPRKNVRRCGDALEINGECVAGNWGPTCEYHCNCPHLLTCDREKGCICKKDLEGLASSKENNMVTIQRQVLSLKSPVYFNKDWDKYVEGFGNKTGSFWLGLKKIHKLCNEDRICRLRFTMKYSGSPHIKYKVFNKWVTNRYKYNDDGAMKCEGSKYYYAQYDQFYISDADDLYRLHVADYWGTAGDSYFSIYNNGQPFSTWDRDNDAWPDHSCAQLHFSGWWFSQCGASNPNGLIGLRSTKSNDFRSAWWNSISDLKTLEEIEMNIFR